MEQTFSVEFDGYWREVNKGGLPEYSGVYCVYECTYNEVEKSVSLNELLYVGETGEEGGILGRIANHEKLEEFKKHVRSGNTLCYSCARWGDTNRERIEAALIFKHQPPVNTEHRDSFDYDTTIIFTSGRNARLFPKFTVQKSQ